MTFLPRQPKGNVVNDLYFSKPQHIADQIARRDKRSLKRQDSLSAARGITVGFVVGSLLWMVGYWLLYG